MSNTKLKELGEKEIIRTILKPLFNPNNLLGLVGDDCAVIDVTGVKSVCISTDRVPADLISFKLGIIDYFELGYYLSTLNIIELNISATSVGIVKNGNVLYREGAKEGDYIFCSNYLGLTSTAFHYFLKAKQKGLFLKPI